MPRINVKDKRKQQLIDANIASIAKRGLLETTIAHVSQGAGMSRGIVNFYFTTKESMMQETCQYLADEYSGAWERAMEKLGKDADAETLLRALVSAHFTAALCNQKKLSVWVAFWGHASSQAEYKRIIGHADAAFAAKSASLWADACKQAENPLAAENFVYELHALIRGSWLNFLLSSQTADRQTLEAKCQDFVTRALANAAMQPEKETASATVTDFATVKEAPRKKQKPVQQDDQPALGDLFALG